VKETCSKLQLKGEKGESVGLQGVSLEYGKRRGHAKREISGAVKKKKEHLKRKDLLEFKILHGEGMGKSLSVDSFSGGRHRLRSGKSIHLMAEPSGTRCHSRLASWGVPYCRTLVVVEEN